jgi:DNA-binding GntR family transcriptional regulator
MAINNDGSKQGAQYFSHTVMSEKVKEYLIETIMMGHFKPGDRIVESTLARQLNISQAPVREAIRDLVVMGFLKTEPYKGISVRSFTAEELFEVYTVRVILESFAGRLAAERMTEDAEQALRNLLNAMIEAAEEKNLDRLTRLDNDFHETIIEIAGNKLILHLWQNLRFGYYTIIRARISKYDSNELTKRNKELLDALKTHDSDRAEKVMRKHIEDLGKPIHLQ